ncbi:Uncharacterized protein QTN25_009042 [Entamoeba marina]
MLVILVVLCTCFNGCVADDELRVHKTTATSGVESVKANNIDTSGRVDFHANHFNEEAVSSGATFETAIKTLTEQKKHKLLKNVRNIESGTTASVKTQVVSEIDALEKTLKSEKKIAFKNLDNQVNIYLNKIKDAQNQHKILVNQESIQLQKSHQALNSIASSSSKALQNGQQVPNEKLNLKNVKNTAKYEGKKVKLAYKTEEHKRRKQLKALRHTVEQLKEEANNKFSTFKSELKTKIKSSVETTKQKIKTIVESSKKAQSQTNSTTTKK